MAKKQKDTSGAGLLLVAALLCAIFGTLCLINAITDDVPSYEDMSVDDGIIDTWIRHSGKYGTSHYTLIIDGRTCLIRGSYEEEDLRSESFVSGTAIHYKWYSGERESGEEIRCIVEAQIDGETLITYNHSHAGNIIMIVFSVIAFLFCILLVVSWINYTDPNR